MGLQIELRNVADFLKQAATPYLEGRTSISVDAACELFLRHVFKGNFDNMVSCFVCMQQGVVIHTLPLFAVEFR
jgi:hypothetical protein